MARLPKRAANQTKHGGARPESSQIQSIERLLRRGEYGDAAGAADELIKRFPNDSAPYRLKATALESMGRNSEALFTAYCWSQVRPNSTAPLREMMRLGAMESHWMLADGAAARLREMGEETPGFPLPDDLVEGFLKQPDGSRVTREEFERFDLGRLLLNAGQDEEAIRVMEGLTAAPAVNNRARALFDLGRVAEAAELFADNGRRHPENLFAIGWGCLARLHLGDEAGARELAGGLREATAQRLEDGAAQLVALLLLGEEQAAWSAYQRGGPALAELLARDPNGATWEQMGGCAAARCGLIDEAKGIWSRLRENSYAKENLKALQGRREAPLFPAVMSIQAYIPGLMKVGKNLTDREFVRRVTASNAYLRAVYRNTDNISRKLAGFFLSQRAAEGDATSRDILLDLLRQPIGDNELRWGLQNKLASAGVLKHGQELEVYDDSLGGLRRVVQKNQRIYRGAKDFGLPEGLREIMQEGVERLTDGDLDGAERHLRKVLEQVPDDPGAQFNLSVVLAERGRGEEAREIVHRLCDTHPDYIFARTSVAQELLDQGKIEEARELVKNLGDAEEMHISEVFELYGTVALIGAHAGESEGVERTMRMLADLAGDEAEKEQFGYWTARILAARLGPEGIQELFKKEKMKR